MARSLPWFLQVLVSRGEERASESERQKKELSGATSDVSRS